MPSSCSSTPPRSASCRDWLASAALLGGALAAAVALAGCKDDEAVDVLERTAPEGESAAEKLAAATRRASEAGPTAEAYRAFALEVESMRPLGAELEADAARSLAFLALEPLDAHAGEPPEARARALALTVWPTALEVEPEPEESPRTYLTRICGGALALECKSTVAAHRALVVSELVWRRLKTRARTAYGACRACEDDPSYQRALDRYHERQSELAAKLSRGAGWIEPDGWPRADDHSRPWPDGAPLLSIAPDGSAQFRREPVPGRSWRDAIRAGRQEADVLGVHLRPEAKISLLRDVLRHAGRAGYRDVAVAVIEPEYPYRRRAYLMPAESRSRGSRVRVRDVDPVQVLVQAIGASLDGADGMARLP